MEFTEQEKKRVAEAVFQAELSTSGEIVPLVVKSSDHYTYADLVCGIMGEIVFLAASYWIFPAFERFAVSGMLVAGFVAGFALCRLVPALKRFVAGQHVARHEVMQRAQQAFFEHNLMRTRDRTGILIMVSLLERRVQVIADEGIHAQVPDGTWDAVVQTVLSEIAAGSVIDGLVAGIAQCGKILSEKFPRKSDDTNEIGDDLIVE